MSGRAGNLVCGTIDSWDKQRDSGILLKEGQGECVLGTGAGFVEELRPVG